MTSPARRSMLVKISVAGTTLACLALSGCALLPWSAVAPTVHLLGIERVAG